MAVVWHWLAFHFETQISAGMTENEINVPLALSAFRDNDDAGIPACGQCAPLHLMYLIHELLTSEPDSESFLLGYAQRVTSHHCVVSQHDTTMVDFAADFLTWWRWAHLGLQQSANSPVSDLPYARLVALSTLGQWTL